MSAHQPPQEKYRANLSAVGKAIDEFLNPEEENTGWVVLMFEFGNPEAGRMNYMSNANREDVIAALKELVAQFEGRAPDTPTTKQ